MSGIFNACKKIWLRPGKGFKAYCVSPPESPGTWSIENRAQIRSAMIEMGMENAFTPNLFPRPAGRVVAPTGPHFVHQFKEDGRTLWTTSRPLEGTWIAPGDGFVMCSSGSPVVVAIGDGKMIVASAGVESLFDTGLVFADTIPREFPSVICSIARCFKNHGIDLAKAELHGFFGADPKVLQMNLGEDIVMHAQEMGFGSATYSDSIPPGGPFPLLAETRNPKRQYLIGVCNTGT